MLKILVSIGFLSFAMGCTTHSQSSEPISYPIGTIYAAVESTLSMGIQSYSENHREITSRPFIVSQNGKSKKLGLHERGRATVTILGEARPYTIETKVAIERAEDTGDPNESEYKVIRYDQGLAIKLLKNILLTLDKNNRDKNIIDDFRSF